jgi:hypothetical protein
MGRPAGTLEEEHRIIEKIPNAKDKESFVKRLKELNSVPKQKNGLTNSSQLLT